VRKTTIPYFLLDQPAEIRKSYNKMATSVARAVLFVCNNESAGCRFFLIFGFIVNLLVFSLNHTTGMMINHGDYTPFAVEPQVSALVYDETHLYTPGPSRFFRTGQLPWELDDFELRDVPNSYAWPVLSTVLLGLLAKGMGRVEWAWMISHAIVPALVWAVLFWNACRFVRSSLLASAIAWSVCFIAFSPRNFLLLGEDRFVQPLELTRMTEPSLGFLFLILSIWLLSRALAKPTLPRILVAAVMAGALFYLYYFYWIAFFAGLVSFIIGVAIIKRHDYAKTAVAVLVLGCFAAIPFLMRTVDAIRSGQQGDLMNRIGSFTRVPDLAGLFVALTLLCALWLYCGRQIRMRSDENFHFGAVLLAVATGAAIGLNFHLLTGFDAQHAGHFPNRALQPLLMYFALLMVLRNVRQPPIAATTAIIGCLIAVAALRQIEVARNTAAYHRETSPDIDVLVWARLHLPADAVIGSNDGNLIMLIPAVAGTWTFVPLGDRSVASNAEILTRYLLLCHLEGQTWQQAEAELTSDLGFKSNDSSLGYNLVMQRKIRPETIELARDIWRNINLQRDFKDRRLDYVIVKRSEYNYNTLYENSAWRVVRVLSQ
jgi:hypothetical protein